MGKMTRFKPKSMQDIETVTLILQIKEETDSSICFLKETEPSIAKDGSFSYASTVAFSRSIYLHAIPQRAFPVLIDNIEKILVHEQIHLALYTVFPDDVFDVSGKFDNLFPMLNDLERWSET
jgi:hypothetical protein